MFAIVAISGKQYEVTAGQIIEVDRLDGEVGAELEFGDVLLLEDGKTSKIGTPFVSGVKVKAKIIDNFKGEKIEVSRYKSKVRHRRHIGFRPLLTKLEIVTIK